MCIDNGIDNIFIAAPGAYKQRIKYLSQNGSGFLYTVARRGITGKRSEINDEALDWIKLVHDNSSLPIAVGFGIQSKDQIVELKGKAEIVVVGSHFVKKINEAVEKKLDIKDFLKNETLDLIK